MEITKINDSTIQVTKELAAPDPIISKYDYDFLVSQRSRIIADANNYIDARQAELDEVNEILDKCDTLGIKSKAMPDKLG